MRRSIIVILLIYTFMLSGCVGGIINNQPAEPSDEPMSRTETLTTEPPSASASLSPGVAPVIEEGSHIWLITKARPKDTEEFTPAPLVPPK